MRTVVCILIVLLLAVQVFAAEPKSGILRVSGDNTWVAYVHGKEVGRGADWQAVGAYPFDLIKGSAVIAVYVHDLEPGASGVGGFLGDIVLDNGDYIGTGIEGHDWKASSDPKYMKDDSWIKPDFDDSKWEEPHVYDKFGAGVWGFGAGAMRNVLKNPDCTAFWVWAGPNDASDDVFFRYTIGKAFAVDSNGKISTTWGFLKAEY